MEEGTKKEKIRMDKPPLKIQYNQVYIQLPYDDLKSLELVKDTIIWMIELIKNRDSKESA